MNKLDNISTPIQTPYIVPATSQILKYIFPI